MKNKNLLNLSNKIIKHLRTYQNSFTDEIYLVELLFFS